MSAALRLSAVYGAIFLVIGIMMPFWPVWLKSRGLDASDIGFVVASGSLLRLVVGPLIARYCDRTGERRRPLIILSLLATLMFLPFIGAHGFWQILVLQAVFAALLGPLNPVIDSMTMIGAREQGLDYGRIRLWGSLSFIVGASGIGFFLKGAPPDTIWSAIMAMLILSAMTIWLLPDFRTPAVGKGHAPLSRVLSDRNFLIFLAAATCVQGSHALYYSFGTLNWLRLGFGEGTIGLLWAEGVIAEVILFVVAGKSVRRIGPARLIALGGFAALVRWGIAAETASVGVFVLLQVLHAFTYAAAHLGAIYFISDRLPTEVSATAQTVYALFVGGIAIGITSMVSGYVYETYAGQAYLLMAAMGGFGGLLAWSVRRRRD